VTLQPDSFYLATHIIFGFSAYSAIKTANADCPWVSTPSAPPHNLLGNPHITPSNLPPHPLRNPLIPDRDDTL